MVITGFLITNRRLGNLSATRRGIKKFFVLEYLGFLGSHNLIYMDKASMAASVEVRVPLLDKNLVRSYFHNIDDKRNIGKKRLESKLKELLGKDDFHSNRKVGFRYPIEPWIKNEINWNEIERYFSSIELFNCNFLKSWVSAIETNYEDVEMKLWCVYTLYVWMKKYNVAVGK